MSSLVSPAPLFERILPGRLDMDSSYRTLRPQGTSDWLLVHTVGGSGRFQVGRVVVTVRPGDAALLPPGTPHAYGTEPQAGHWSLLFAHVHPRPDWAALLAWPDAGGGVRRLTVEGAARDRVQAALERCVRVSRTGLRQSTALALAALEEALLWYDTANPRGGSLDTRLVAVLDRVATGLDQPHTVSSLAAAAGLSPSRLAHLFAAELGTSVMGYVERRRVEVARELLELTSAPVGEVARQVGYGDPLYFSRRFRAAVGQSPTAFRRERNQRADPRDARGERV